MPFLFSGLIRNIITPNNTRTPHIRPITAMVANGTVALLSDPGSVGKIQERKEDKAQRRWNRGSELCYTRILYELNKPGILLWDDFENGLDPATLSSVSGWLSSLVEKGVQVVVTTRSPEAARRIVAVPEARNATGSGYFLPSSLTLVSPGLSIDMWVKSLSSAAPCQWYSPEGM